VIELHCHLDGVVDPAMLRELAERGLPLPLSADELDAVLPVVDMESFTRWFEVAHRLEGHPAVYEAVLELQLQRWCAQGVDYAELMVGSSELPDDLADLTRLRRRLDALEAGRIRVELLVAVNRRRSLASMEALLSRLEPCFERRELVGVAIAGWPEQGRPVAALRPLLAALKARGVGIEIHAGEWAGPASVRDALEAGADRIGHGVTAFEDAALIDELVERGVHVEMCPTSNLKTGAIARLSDHPIRRAVERGMRVSIHSDDPGAFGCDVASEHTLMREVFGFDESVFATMDRDARRARFGKAARDRGDE
jgi:adenosine deaminase